MHKADNGWLITPHSHAMSGYRSPWWIAGGWAIDLHLGRQTRAHADLDIAALRRDQPEIQRLFADWSLHKVVGGALQPWRNTESLLPPIHEIHGKRGEVALELLLNESDGDNWIFRRMPAISMPLSQVGRHTASGLPYLCPEIVLLFKAKTPRQHDVDDFQLTAPTLDTTSRQWLVSALEACHPEHDWLSRL
ncbi:nucleotidyltransferase domain-containing protein [Uliginosibacterium sp. H1]|uniref:nucleotidyltransferase domain-containing protein n=1 Tax=Uliginosibacterium sp. H1 TaxID=3114757 RepID=UPI002E1873CD|nr:hypothetical protein [Uliginosibacterium sp. H1]